MTPQFCFSMTTVNFEKKKIKGYKHNFFIIHEQWYYNTEARHFMLDFFFLSIDLETISYHPKNGKKKKRFNDGVYVTNVSMFLSIKVLSWFLDGSWRGKFKTATRWLDAGLYLHEQTVWLTRVNCKSLRPNCLYANTSRKFHPV